VKNIAPHTRYLVVLGICLALATCFRLALVPLTPNDDYVSYVETAQYFSGVPSTIHPERILKPLGPLGVAALETVTDQRTAFVTEVVIFYFAFAIAFYFLAFEFFENKKLALMAALLGAISYPMLRYGLDLYTETGAQFFYVLSLFFMLRYMKQPSTPRLIYGALAIGVGLLWKEYTVVAGFGFGLILLFESVPLVQKFKNLVVLGIASLLPSALMQGYVYESFHYTYLDWYKSGGASGFSTQYTPKNLIKSIAALLGLAWIAVPFGILELKAHARENEMVKSKTSFVLLTTIASLLCLCWGYVSSRLFFVMAVPFILIALVGLARLPRRLQWAAFVAVLIGNILWLVIASGVLKV
jgi:hypothetical protein